MGDSQSRLDPDTNLDAMVGWAQAKYLRALRSKVDEFDRACASMRRILFDLRRLLRKD